MSKNKTQIKKHCLTCNKEFSIFYYLKDKRKYCSFKCRQGKIISTCLFCKKEFEHFKSCKNRKFCSKECFNKGKDKTNLRQSNKIKNEKISKKLKGRIISEEQRLQHGIKMRTRFGELGIKGKFTPNFSLKACELIDNLGKLMGYNFKHALNGGEYYIKELGYWVDGYDKENNIIVEYYEKYHRNPKKKKYDEKREKEITDLLKCKFIIIWELVFPML